MTALTSQQTIDRAHRASEILDNPTLQKAFEGVRQAMLERIEATNIGDRDTQHELALSLQILKSVRRMLENWVRDGQVEKHRNAK